MRCRSRTFAGAGIATVAVAAVLALSGCGSDSAHDEKKQLTPSPTASGQQPSPTPSPSGAAVATTSAPAETGDPTQSAEGVWLAVHGSTKIQLALGKGKAALTSTHLCGGSYTDQDGIALLLTCMDGDKERTSGRGVLAADGKTLTVRWAGNLTDTFSRTGLPSN
ncbi:hypothetical protein [Streptomyces sp.]|uniref:hypothetical protein n=1 Tax=Streptomyces sp. TaxID=1931 RepID=UPI002F3E3A26